MKSSANIRKQLKIFQEYPFTPQRTVNPAHRKLPSLPPVGRTLSLTMSITGALGKYDKFRDAAVKRNIERAFALAKQARESDCKCKGINIDSKNWNDAVDEHGNPK